MPRIIETEIYRTINVFERLTEPQAFLVVLAFSLVIASLLVPFYSIDDADFSIIGSRNSRNQVGCLGYCTANANNNCMGDEANINCQIIQALYIIVTIILGISLFSHLFKSELFSINIGPNVPFISTLEKYIRAIFSNIVVGLTTSVLSVLLLVIGLIVTCLVDISGFGSINDQINNDPNRVQYESGFIFLLVAIGCLLLNIFITGAGTANLLRY